MDSVTLENFRCFRERQTVKLAPLTLLVGENSTGKTSFLALVHALTELVLNGHTPTFKQAPFDLGSFDEIAYKQKAMIAAEDAFSAGLSTTLIWEPTEESPPISEVEPLSVDFLFGRPTSGTTPSLCSQRVATREVSILERLGVSDTLYEVKLGTRRGQWGLRIEGGEFGSFGTFLRLTYAASPREELAKIVGPVFEAVDDSPTLSTLDAWQLSQLDIRYRARFAQDGTSERSLAAAPVRSAPQRTYNPSATRYSSEGSHVPSYLADLVRRQDPNWMPLKERIEAFGRSADLFDEIEVRPSDAEAGSPLQLQFRRGDAETETPFRNLVDVGYGVSQVLPIVTELLQADAAPQYLVQQPEVHLHPSAQAELGSLFCEVAAQGRQLIVETHSDHLMNRIRMDVRDQSTALQPQDVLILYFERQDQDVRIHEITIDEQGNICGAPDSYREFFRLESRRSLGL